MSPVSLFKARDMEVWLFWGTGFSVLLHGHRWPRLRLNFCEIACINFSTKTKLWGFPSGPEVKNPPANAGDTGSVSRLGRSHMLWGS